MGDDHPGAGRSGALVSADEASGDSWEYQADELPEARVLAGRLDADHAPEPGGLQDIGTCRRCGLIIAKDTQGVWHHQPSVGEIDAGETWIDRNPSDGSARSEPFGTGPERAEASKIVST